VDEYYCALLGNNAPMKTLVRNHVTCSLCGLPYATIELCFLCVSVRRLYNENNTSTASNTFTVTLRVVGGEEQGSLKSETV
jgi:hypothetical protein